ncbi:hypothetical protein [Kushneria phosphatilytica]|uniref:Uncharacterized protein n=1 Tax=Kushneria phosphatilytica TaxID=657387 RepID=A0A1S1NU50_9GAMM|nr:hypothetical protein [Kushneria phosphatilytica]OHV10856.1 hypothetical protein BH688_08125 [Kushneria phosphatilytica]QEL12060.1 hypothetical protein FY550_13545 [Kushneria phosphatilytica]
MSDSGFYATAMRGLSEVIDHWLTLGDASVARLGIILADTARVAKLGTPESDPGMSTLEQWRRETPPPLWAARAAIFLLTQMPARPRPRTSAECAAWGYVWIRLRHHESPDEAAAALPEHLRIPLTPTIEQAWQDRNDLRLL